MTNSIIDLKIKNQFVIHYKAFALERFYLPLRRRFHQQKRVFCIMFLKITNQLLFILEYANITIGQMVIDYNEKNYSRVLFVNKGIIPVFNYSKKSKL